MISGVANSGKIEDELKHLIDSKWDWKTKQVSKEDFLVTFPNKDSLEIFSKPKKIELALHNIVAQVTKTNKEWGAVDRLEAGWVQIHKILDFARTMAAVKLIAELAGDVIVVDELSLIREGPVRVKIWARNISKINGNVRIFIEDQGYDFKFVPEQQGRGTFKRDVNPKRHSGDTTDEEEEDEDNNLIGWEKAQRAQQNKGKNKEVEKNIGSSQQNTRNYSGNETHEVMMENGRHDVSNLEE